MSRSLGAGKSSLDDDPDIDDSFLVGVAAAPSVDPDAKTQLLPGDHVLGKYRIEGRIGRGGMGTVYRATDTRLQRTVAIKIHHSLTTRVERLRREARMLARLSHPNVVTVLEVGVHDGTVFVAMEYVDGGNARTWLADAPRSWREIVELYQQAGRGLAAAHALGIVHRDFKPDNVLVGVAPAGQPHGRVLVADFGLAGHAIDAELGVSLTGDPMDRTEEVAPTDPDVFDTEVGMLVGTPAYVAPEQIASSRVDARADQFAFCAALFEALYGELPYPGSTALEILARIAGGDMTRPRHVGRAPGWVLRVLERGLAHAPARRFADMGALLVALGGPRRRRGRLMLAGMATAAVLGAVALSNREDAAPGCDGPPASDEWQRRRGEIAERVAALGDPSLDAWTPIDRRLGEYIDDWSTTRLAVCAEFGEVDVVDARLRGRRLECLADVGMRMDALIGELAEPTHDAIMRAAEIAARLPEPSRCLSAPASTVDPPPAAIAEDVDALRGELARATAQFHLGRVRSAAALADVVVARAQQLGYGPLVSDALILRARTRATSGREQAGIEDARGAYDEASRVGYHRGMSQAADLLAHVAMDGERLDEALSWNAEARTHIERPHEQALLIVMLVAREAELRARRGEYDASLALLDEADATISDRGLGEEVRGIVLHARGEVAQDRGEYGEAVAMFERARDAYARSLGPRNHHVAMQWALIGNAYQYAGNFLEARNALAQALALWEQGERASLQVIQLTGAVAAMDDMLGRGEDALRGYEEADAMLAASDVDKEYLQLSLTHARGVTLIGLGRDEEALVELRRALELGRRTYGDEHPQLRNTLANLALAARSSGRYDEAEVYLQRALRIQSALQQLDPMAASLLHAYGFLLLDRGRLDEAAQQFERAAEAIEQVEGGDAIEMGWAELGRGRVALARGKPELALAPLIRADALWPPDSVPPEDRAELRRYLAMARWDTGDRAGARAIADAQPEDAQLRAWLALQRR